MTFDRNYYYAMCRFFCDEKNQDRVFEIKDLTADYERFVFHVKKFIDHNIAEVIPDKDVLIAPYGYTVPIVEFNNQTETEIMYGAPWCEIKVIDPDHTFRLERVPPWLLPEIQQMRPDQLPPRMTPGQAMGMIASANDTGASDGDDSLRE
jgi:hypothetical protein